MIFQQILMISPFPRQPKFIQFLRLEYLYDDTSSTLLVYGYIQAFAQTYMLMYTIGFTFRILRCTYVLNIKITCNSKENKS